MSKLCFFSVPYPHVKSYFDMIDCSLKHGLDYLEGFNRFELATPDLEAAKSIKAYADQKGIKFACFSVFINLVGDDSFQMLERLKGFARVCAVLECPLLHHTIANNFSDPDKVLSSREESYQKGILAVREIFDYAQKLGVKTVYENQGYIFNGVEGFAHFLKDVDRNVGVVADLGNIYQAGDTAEAFVKTFGRFVSHVHIKNVSVKENNDNGRGLKTLQNKYMFDESLENGCVDVARVIALLRAKGYNGFYGLEFGAGDDASQYMKESIIKINSWLN